jgi:hypothetical protein
MSAASAQPRIATKRLAGALSFVCLVLFLLAIEQKQTVAAWEGFRDGAGPAVRGVADWARRLPDGAADGLAGLRSAIADEARPLAAEPGSAVILRGEYGPADAAARTSIGALAVVGAELRFESGERLRTRPLRIAYGQEAFAPGQTFAARLDAPADAQIELREVIAPAGGRPVPPSALCGGEPAGVAALLHRRHRVDLMLFRAGAAIGPDTPPSALCGVWSFKAR